MRPKPDFLPRMRGATGSVAGRRGLVPKPAAADNVKYLKGDGSWSALSNASAATDAEAAAGTSTTTFVTPANAALAVAKVVNTRAPRGGLAFDGTSGVAVTNIPAFGTGDFTVLAWVKLTAINTGSDQYIVKGATGSFGLVQGAASKIQAAKPGVGYVATASTSTLTAGRLYLIGYSRTGTTGTYWFDRSSGGTTVDSYDYTVAITEMGSQTFAGVIAQPLVFNRALTAAEVLALYEQGAPAAVDYNSASNTSVIPAASGNFSTDTYFTKSSATINTGTQKCTISAGGNIQRPALVPFGKKFRLTVVVDSGTVSVSNGYIAYLSGVGSGTYEFTATDSRLDTIYIFSTGGAVLSSVSLYNLGLLCAPEANAPGNGLVWNDQSGNGAHIVLPATGVAWALPDNRVNRIRATTSTNGNQQLLAAAYLGKGGSQMLKVRARARTGTPTVTLGHASGVASYVASVALTAFWKDLTLVAAMFDPGANTPLWAGSNSTDVVEWDISVEPLSY